DVELQSPLLHVAAEEVAEFIGPGLAGVDSFAAELRDALHRVRGRAARTARDRAAFERRQDVVLSRLLDEGHDALVVTQLPQKLIGHVGLDIHERVADTVYVKRHPSTP